MCLLLMGCGGAGEAAFSPLDISGLQLWLEADSGLYQERTGASATTPASSDSDPVGTWLDQSGNANHATASADSKRPVVKLAIQNGLPVVRFDGVDDFLACAGLTKTQIPTTADVSFFVVGANRRAAAAEQAILYLGNSNVYSPNYHQVALGTDGTNYRWRLNTFDNSEAESEASSDLVQNDFYLLHAERSSSNVRLYINSVAQTASAAVAPNINSSATLHIGLDQGGAGSFITAFSGDIIAILVYDSALSTENREAVEAYLNDKYGIY